MREVFIASIKSAIFDYDKPGDWNGYEPAAICKSQYHTDLFWDIMGYVADREPNSKQTDWGCRVIKLKKSDLTVYLDNDKYRKYEFELKCLNYLLKFVQTLNDTDEYLLVALEWG
jgi:hypothetical protein